jgi:hypothetical protein
MSVSEPTTPSRKRVVAQACDFHDLQAGLPTKARKFGRLEEARVFVGAARQQVEQVLGAEHGDEIGLGIAIQRGQENLATRLDQLAQAATVLAGSGTCSSISRQVTWSKAAGAFFRHGFGEISR